MKTLDDLFEINEFTKAEKEAFLKILSITKLAIDGTITDTQNQINSVIEGMAKNDSK